MNDRRSSLLNTPHNHLQLHLNLSLPDHEPQFDLLVIGCGGGPLETNLSSYIVKPKHLTWKQSCTALEGGSTIGAISTLVEQTPYSFEGFELGIGVDREEQQRLGVGENNSVTAGVGREGGGRCAGKIWEMIRSFAITHSHLDHISGLVLSSAACTPPPKTVYGLKRTVENLEKIMDGGAWPMLGGWDEGVTRGRAYVWKEIEIPSETSSTTTTLPSYRLSPSLTMTALPISHGADPSHFHRPPSKPPPPPLNEGGPNGIVTSKEKQHAEAYDSTAFFVKCEMAEEGERPLEKEFLFFGDVEPDSISARPLNRPVWELAAKKIVDQRLNVIFLECSYPSSQPKDKLFGHLSPPFVLEEIQVLAELVQEERIRRGMEMEKREGPLEGVFVVIQHIKDDIFTAPTTTSVPPPAKTSTSKSPSSPSSRSTTPSSTSSTSRSTSSNDPTTLTTTTSTKKPLPLSLSSTKEENDSTSNPSMTSPLSMSPPIPTVPLRRPSIQLSQFSFPSPSTANSPKGSPSMNNNRRSSLFPTTTTTNFDSRKLSTSSSSSILLNSTSLSNNSLSPSSSTSSSSLSANDHSMGRRKSTPWAFGFGGTSGLGGTTTGGAEAIKLNRRGSASPPTFNRTLSGGGGLQSPLRKKSIVPCEVDEDNFDQQEDEKVSKDDDDEGKDSREMENVEKGFETTRIDMTDKERVGSAVGVEESETIEGEPMIDEGVENDEEEEAEEEEECEELVVELVEETVHERIERELNELEEEARTGVQFVIARQGMRLIF